MIYEYTNPDDPVGTQPITIEVSDVIPEILIAIPVDEEMYVDAKGSYEISDPIKFMSTFMDALSEWKWRWINVKGPR